MLHLSNVSYAYARTDKPPHQVLFGVDLTIQRGEFVAILGHNGSGKSTLAKLLNALLVPTTGSVLVNGLDTKNDADWLAVRQSVGMVFQNPDNQLVATIVEEDVAFALENLGVPPDEMRRRVDEALDTVGMLDYRLHAPHKLSGGQKQRVAIAGALAMRPACLVLDEPTAMLDPVGRDEILKTLHKLNAEGMTVILITHHMEEAVNASRVLVMDRGRIVMDAPPREVFSRVDALHELSLSAPQPTELVHALGLDDVALTIEQAADAVVEGVDAGALAPRKAAAPQLLAETTPLLEIDAVGFTYGAGSPFEKKALDGVSMTFGAGELVGVIGHTGSGKSTLMQLLNGLLKPHEGRVLFDGTDINSKGYDLRGLRFKVGLVFQYPEYQLFEQTVAADIGFGPKNQKLAQADIDARVRDAARVVGLDDEILAESPFALSGGQQRRVAIAGVLAMRPQVLILDEPTAGLDPAGRAAILAQIKDYHDQTNATVILVTHGMEEIADVCQRIVVLKQGGVLLSGAPREVFGRSALLADNGLAVPQVTAVLQRAKATCPTVDDTPVTVAAAVKALGGDARA